MPTSPVLEAGKVKIGGDNPLVLIAGPCVMEDRDTNMYLAEALWRITSELGVPWVFKSSYDKGNRGLGTSYRGPMLEEGLKGLAEIREEFQVPVITDVHSRQEARAASGVVDIIQIPAYLCMQTSLVVAAAETGRPLNVKKGQFLSPRATAGIVQKVEGAGGRGLMLTERGTVFGYGDLVADMRSLPTMRSLGVPVVFDVTHVLRRPGTPSSDPGGGQPELVPHLARAAVGAGVDALFVETHQEPCRGRCDASSMYPLHLMKELLLQVMALDEMVRQWDLTPRQRSADGFLR